MTRAGKLPRSTAVLIPIALLLAGCVAPAAEDQLAQPSNVGGFSTNAVVPGDFDFSGPYSRPLAPGQYEVLPLEIVDLVAEVDGKPIEFGLVRPAVPEGTRVPVLLLATPYQHGFRDQPLSAGAKGVDNPWDDRALVPYGYALAILPMRGTGNTGGCSDMNGPLDAAILDQVLTWLGTQAWSNGNIGMYGLSSPGSTPWVAAGTGNPYLKTIVPVAGLNDQFLDVVYNGSFLGGGVGPGGPAFNPLAYYGLYGPISYNPGAGRSPENTIDGVICPETLAGIATAAASALTRERDVSGYYERRNMRDEVEANYHGSVFMVHGFTDLNVMPHHAYPWVRTLEDRGIVVKHLLGQWNHTYPDAAGDPENPRGMRWDFQEKLLHWFDYWLKGDMSVDLGPVAEVQDSAGRWRAETSWPPRDAHPLQLSLSAGRLTSGPVPAGTQDWELPAAIYLADASTEDLLLTGTPHLRLVIVPSAPVGEIFASLVVHWPDGHDSPLTFTTMDVRFAAGGETPQPVTVGQPLTLQMEFEAFEGVVPAGTQLDLDVYAGNGWLSYQGEPPFTILEGEDASLLTLLTIERDESAYFTPPMPAGESANRAVRDARRDQ